MRQSTFNDQPLKNKHKMALSETALCCCNRILEAGSFIINFFSWSGGWEVQYQGEASLAHNPMTESKRARVNEITSKRQNLQSLHFVISFNPFIMMEVS
jgi:hypothetical protein